MKLLVAASIVLMSFTGPLPGLVKVDIVEPDGQASTCSAVRIGRKHAYFLTVNHCATGEETLLGQKASIELVESTMEENPTGLAILLVPDGKGTKAIELASTPHVGDEMSLFGYPMDSLQPIFSPGMIISVDGKPLDDSDFHVAHFAVHGAFGMSGGAFVDKHGKLVSVLLGSYAPPLDWVTIGADIKHVQDVVKQWRDK